MEQNLQWNLYLEYKRNEIRNQIRNKYSEKIYAQLSRGGKKRDRKKLKRTAEYREAIEKRCMEVPAYRQLQSGSGEAWDEAVFAFAELEPLFAREGVKTMRQMNRCMQENQDWIQDKQRREALKMLEELDLPVWLEEHMDQILKDVVKSGEKFFRKKKQKVWILDSRFPGKGYWILSDDNYETYLNDMLGLAGELQTKQGKPELYPEVLREALKSAPEPYRFVIDHHPQLQYMLKEKVLRRQDVERICAPFDARIGEEVRRIFTLDRIVDLLRDNPAHRKTASRMKEFVYQKRALQNAVFQSVPDDYIDLYPAARRMYRHFILHVGGTNSGKTYNAMEELKKKGNGIYLAPLRLLAYEQFDRLNMEGYPCDLITGEEEQFIPFARYQASTIEMADYAKHYDIAVIDEAQMIDDHERGGNWTGAILGLCADEIHVCMAPEAEELVRKIIEQCGDHYEIHYYERKTPLLVEDEEFLFPADVRRGDALIAFSRKQVHSIASKLKEENISCSLIYGALPHDVRHREADRFLSGETQVIVSTDAIGMGMNLPIRRIVFLELDKFDGVERRILKPEEVRQIAGRAGRYGIYDTGYVTSLYDRDLLRELLERQVAPLDEAVVGVPVSLLSIDAPLSEILRQWNTVPVAPGFKREDVSEQIRRAEVLEEYTDDKLTVYRLVMIPFDEKEEEILDLWESLSVRIIRGESVDFTDYIPSIPRGQTVQVYERDYKICDMLYAMVRHFGRTEEKQAILFRKQELSHEIFKLLSEDKKYQPNLCKRCGRKLPWNYQRGICESCYRRRFR